MAKIQKITPFLWFNNEAEEAANFYVSLFSKGVPMDKKSKINRMVGPEGQVMVVDFSLAGQNFNALNGGPMYKISPAISFFITCRSASECKTLWKKLGKGGMVFMKLDKYEWSELYGWVQDKYGIGWQIILDKPKTMGKQKLIPNLLFSGKMAGRGEEAVQFYTSIFPKSEVQMISQYKPGGTGQAGSLEYAQFLLAGQSFTAMDNPNPEAVFGFSEGLSFVVSCKNQREVDFFWEKLIADGGSESQCGWLKDKFGMSWQIIPEALPKLLGDPDPTKAQTAMAAMMRMKKIVVRSLGKMPKPHKPITVKTAVKGPIDKVWRLWTEAEHIEKWNNASADWHTPKATNDLRTGGRFVYTMAARDGSVSFDFGGTYSEVVENQRIAYTMDDGRTASIVFREKGSKTEIIETFDPENENSRELQQGGWQSILDNFKKYAEQKTV